MLELVKGEPLPHLWTHLLETTDALLYVIYDESNTLANVKDITELLLDDRTNSMPIMIVICNSSDKYDKAHFDEINTFLGQYKDQKKFEVKLRSISGSKREVKLQQMISVL